MQHTNRRKGRKGLEWRTVVAIRATSQGEQSRETAIERGRKKKNDRKKVWIAMNVAYE